MVPSQERLELKEANLAQVFSDHAERYIIGKPRPRSLKPSTEANYRYLLERHILPVFGSRRIDRITPASIQKWCESLPPRRPTERAHAYALLRSIMQFAVDLPLALTDPREPRQPPSAGRVAAKGRLRTATLEELQLIVDNMPDRLQLAVLIASWCGLRQGETMELRREDVNLARATLSISRAVTRVAGSDPIVGDPSDSTSSGGTPPEPRTGGQRVFLELQRLARAEGRLSGRPTATQDYVPHSTSMPRSTRRTNALSRPRFPA